MGKIMIFVICIMLITSCVLIFPIKNVKASRNTLYVGGSGPGNYTTIQNAIDNARDGDIIYCYHGTYYENIRIDVSVTLIGEDTHSTIIDGEGKDATISITADGVVVTRFTIRNSVGRYGTEGIVIKSNQNRIVENNIVVNSLCGISLSRACDNNISLNMFSNCYYGIYLFDSDDNTIMWNTILAVGIGLVLSKARFNSIIYNNITGCFINCIYSVKSIFNKITSNNLISMFGLLIASKTVFSLNSYNKWYGNYYDGGYEVWFGHNIIVKTLPRPICGRFLFIPWVNFDWHQAKQPYDIPHIS